MRRTILTLLLLVVVAWAAPPQIEDVQGQCRALDALVQRGQAPQVDAEGAVRAAAVAARVAAYARDSHPTLPRGLACFLTYWEFTYDPDLSMFQEGVAP